MRRITIFVLVLVLCLLPVSVWASPVPDQIPADYGGKTFYGYLVELRDTYLPADIFTNAAAWTDQDRENARRAAQLIVDAVTQSIEASGTADQYTLYLRGRAYEHQFLDSKDPALRIKAMDDYRQVIDMGSVFAEADYDRVEALEVMAADLNWDIPEMLTLDEVRDIVGDGQFMFMAAPYARDDGTRLGVGYAVATVSDPAATTMYFLVDPQGGHARFDVLKRMAFLGVTKDLTDIGDAAFSMGLRNTFNDPLLYRTVVVLSGEMVIQVRVPDYVWRGPGFNLDPEKIAADMAVKLLDNLYDTERETPGAENIVIEDLKPIQPLFDAAPVSAIPAVWPEDLGGKTTYGHIVELRQTYLPGDIFTSDAYDQQAKEDARQAILLIVQQISDEFDANGPNPYNLEIRAFCYYLVLTDTENPVFRQLAVNDYKQALHLDYSPARSDYNIVARPLLTDMAEEIANGSDAYISRMQDWLIQAGLLLEPVSEEATTAAVKALEEAFGMTIDGVADIDLLLALHSRIDDGDWLYFLK